MTNEKSYDWKLEGDYFDGCNCKNICPCIFALDPTEGDCKGLAAWHIEKGHFVNRNNDNNSSINLANLNVIMSIHAPGHMFTGPKWKMALYLDERANNDQKDALTKIFTGQVGGEFVTEVISSTGEMLGIRSVPIEFDIEGKKRRIIKIPSLVEMEIEGLTGSDPNVESKIVNPAFSGTPGDDPIIAHSTRHIYKDHGLEWDNSGRNAFYSRFTYGP
ncbi:MAG: DUF1326 domain-containing protein [Thermoproteota archaeon]|jgi:hypothetical protein|nr:DUF1326 domain-containing protein [Thermoproteota archaeon]